MKHYTGLDVSLKTTFIRVIDNKQSIVMEGEVATEADVIFSAFLTNYRQQQFCIKKHEYRVVQGLVHQFV